MVRSLGKGAKLLKLDIEHAFRIIRVNVQDFYLLGMYFNGYYYVDKALPFWPLIFMRSFEKFSRFVEWWARLATNNPNIIHYLDDFMGGAADEEGATNTLSTLLSLFADLDIPVSHEKNRRPVNLP